MAFSLQKSQQGINNFQSYHFNKLFSEISIIIFFIIFINTIFLILSHPLAMGLVLIIQTALAAAATGIIAGTF